MLHRWDPFAELSRLQDQVARTAAPRRERAFQPSVDIHEEKDAIVVRAELPGVKPEDVSITVENDLLTISGERRFEKREEGDYHRVEMTYGAFTRSFALPKTLASDAIEANLDAGVLTVRLPKRQESKPRKIDVKIGGAPAKAIDAKA
ncbi:MAG: Hsp20/alpha crystallin family protein [Polyangiales bacterium]